LSELKSLKTLSRLSELLIRVLTYLEIQWWNFQLGEDRPTFAKTAIILASQIRTGVETTP